MSNEGDTIPVPSRPVANPNRVRVDVLEPPTGPRAEIEPVENAG